MSREWKSGDVILHPDGLLGLVVETGAGCANHFKHGDLHVHYKDGDWGALVPDDARPLVVIDPEDREQVERLAKCYRELHGEAEFTDEPWSVPGLRMQAALREFANPKPPKPEEPTGWLAAVIDDMGDKWVRDGMPGDRNQSGHWWNHTVASEKNYVGLLRADWHAINAVKVLSDGVPS